MKRAVPYLIGIGEFQRQAASVIKTLTDKHGEGFIISHNEPKAVLLSLDRYAKLKALEEAKRIEENEVLSVRDEGDREFELGKTRKARSLKDFL